MKLNKALENFSRLKEEILKDGKIDKEEVKILLEFLRPYTMTYSVRFTKLRNALYEALSSGVENKQQYLIEMIEKAEDFLVFENRFEKIVGGMAILMLLGMTLLMIFT